MIRTNIRPFPLLCAISWLKRNLPHPTPAHLQFAIPTHTVTFFSCLVSSRFYHIHTLFLSPHHHPPLLYLHQFLDFLVHFLGHPFIAALPSVIYTLILAPVFKKHYAKVATAMQTRPSSIFAVSWRLTRVCRPREYCLMQLRGKCEYLNQLRGKCEYLNTRRVWQLVCAAGREGGGDFGHLVSLILLYCSHFIFVLFETQDSFLLQPDSGENFGIPSFKRQFIVLSK